MELLANLATELLGSPPAERLSYAEAFARYAGIDPHRAAPRELAAAAERGNVAMPADAAAFDRDGWLNLLLAELIEPRLGAERPTILYDYPASQSALARVRAADPPVSERFELYVRGIELANGYHELTDAAELRRRNAAANSARALEGKPPLPEESRLLAAMDHGLPDATGVALGFDRLVMVATGASSLAEVMPFPIARA
jgi:lysyl-tRNA synthetase class 2